MPFPRYWQATQARRDVSTYLGWNHEADVTLQHYLGQKNRWPTTPDARTQA
jgi:hypothetical protein